MFVFHQFTSYFHFFSLRTELEENFVAYDKILHGILESSASSSSNDPENVQRDIDQLNNEIETLADAARTKELEWNNILYLKKMKEELLLRLNRKKTVLEIMSTKIIDDPENLSNYSNSNSNEVNLVESKDFSNGANVRKQLANAVPPTTSFIMSRCNMNSSDLAKERSNMNSSDLAKEKSNISKLHR